MTQRRTAARVVVAVVLVVVSLFGAVQLVDSLRTASKRATDYREQEPFRREFPSAWVIGLDREFMTAAAAFVGPGDSFAVEHGPRVSPEHPWELGFLVHAVRSELVPARQTTPAAAGWLLCYGCVRPSRADFERVWADGPYAVLRRTG